MSAEPHYQINIPAQDVAKALDELAEQTGAITLFPYDLVEGIISKPVKGRYTLSKSLNLMLKNTGLSGGLSDKRVINISVATNAEKSPTNDEEESMSIRKMKKTGIVSFFAALIAGSGAAQAQDTNTSAELEEIVVTGIRASLNRGLEVKRGADSIVDAISAEDLGKFPDQNVAESLQRITGVAITRSRGGEGQFVTVRGLGQEFNTLTYNGRELATENAGREFSFDVVPSELISAAQVFKSTKASQTDGSIGGLVNIETAKPLSNPGFHAAASLSGQYEELADDTGPKAALVISNTFADDTIGVIGSFSYQKRDFRTDTAESIAVDTSTDFNGDGVNDRLNSFNGNINSEERERLGATIAVQYQPNDNTEIVIDGLYTSFESPSESSAYSYFPNPGVVGNNLVVGSDVLNQTANFTPGNPFSNVFDYIVRRAATDTETYQIGGNLKQRLNDRWTSEFDLSISNSDGVRDNIGSNAGSGSFFVVSFPGLNFSETNNGGRVPDISFSALPNINATSTVPVNQLTSDGARFHFSRNSSNFVEDDVATLKADFEYEISDTANVKFGFDYIDREKTVEVFDNNATTCGSTAIALPTLGLSPQGTPANSFICDRSIAFNQVLPQAQLDQLFTPFTGSGFLSDAGANVPREFLVANVDIVDAGFQALADLASASTGSNVPSFLTPVLNASSSSKIEEENFSFYVEMDFDGQLGNIPFRANAGVRFTNTDLTSSGAAAQIIGITIDSVSGNNQPQLIAGAPVVETNSYFDVLPSFNIGFDLQENLKLRAGFSRSLARPTFNDLTTVFSLDQFNAGQEQSSGSNPQLEAVRSDNFDVSLEWYGDNGLSVSGALFYKDITNFIQNVNTPQDILFPNAVDLSNNPLPDQLITYTFSGPQNSDTAEVYGLELGGQYLLDSGFGIAANVTLAESESTLNGVTAPLENISDFTGNLSVFYEGNGLQARISANTRSDFLSATNGESGGLEFTDDFTQIDVSLSYNLEELIGQDISVFLEGINITGEEVFTFAERATFLETFQENGARYLFGIRSTF